MVNAEISALITRLKSGTKPDRKLDRALFKVCEPDCEGEAPEYTGSVVAALTLFPDPLSARDLCAAALIGREQEK